MRLLWIPPLLLAACGGSSGPEAPAPKESIVRNDRTQDIGRASLAQKGDHLQLHLRATGLKPGVHGMHVHAAGVCAGPAFTTSGAHLNPSRAKHGRKNAEGPHLGDLGNLTVDKDGKGETSVDIKGAEAKAGLKTFLGGDGVSVIIHADRDDETTDPSGNSGARVACVAFRP